MRPDKRLTLSRNLRNAHIFLCTALLFSASLPARAETFPAEDFTVYVVNYPLQYFAERIGGEHVTVVFPAPSDVDPAYWRPDAKVIAEYQAADLILLNGAGYANWVSKASLARSKTSNTSARFIASYLDSGEVTTHSHGPEGDHAHESLAFTTWLDFSLAAKHARAIMDNLSRKLPEHKGAFMENFQTLEKDLMAMDSEMKSLAAQNPSLPLIVSHPVYTYWAHRYGLNIQSVHWEPNEIPSKEQMDELRVLRSKHPARWMVWEGDPVSESVEKLKTLGMNSLVFDPCGNVPDQGDFLTAMRKNIENLRQIYD